MGDQVSMPEFSIGQQVRIIRRETWQGEICTITKRSRIEPDMYWLKEHGWRRADEIEVLSGTEPRVLAVFAVLRDRDLYALHLSCGHTLMFCHHPSPEFLAFKRRKLIGNLFSCYGKHDQQGRALVPSVDPQQEADELYFVEGRQCFMCGAALADATGHTCEEN